ncbi:hypothetical protein SAMN04488103_101505 [Gemmobacter aquatilis]|uniref:MOSC domain-containing protein n=1 Tax=Gemmobacter aquatilis TaxID=933059 RepID=A0A1H7ZHL0_9RHOB|nr:hypothetical protein SAMN04488103_101505 [Gemmobacter aquatilis]
MAELMAALPHVLAAPRDDTPILQLCFRPGYNQRSFPDSLTATRARGIPGERFETAPWARLPDGSGDPRIQISILPLRVMDLVWRDRAATPHPGDTIIADLNTTEENLPVGTLLQAGTALLRVSDLFNDACVKWKVRYGTEAKDWVTLPGHPELRLRGILCSVEQDGVMRVGDRLKRV